LFQQESKYCKDYILHQDYGSIHVSTNNMTKFFEESAIFLLKLPFRLPDLNLMKNIWNMVPDLSHSAQQPETIEELRRKVLQAFDVIN